MRREWTPKLSFSTTCHREVKDALHLSTDLRLLSTREFQRTSPLWLKSLEAVLFESDGAHYREEFDQGLRRPLGSVHFCQAAAAVSLLKSPRTVYNAARFVMGCGPCFQCFGKLLRVIPDLS
jgi:hypothetical protein